MSDENYGDVSLNGGRGLPANWSRSRYEKQQHINSIVGHVEGVADARLTKSPKSRHQFFWAHPSDHVLIDVLREQGYDLVKKDSWSKNEKLWTWTAEGLCLRMGDHLWARPEQLYREEAEARLLSEKNLDKEANKLLAQRAEQVMTDGRDGMALRPMVRA